ncbi:MAG: FGGY family carbohydrate kinase [[Clostridium] leptum]
MSCFLGIDAGTSGVKAVVMDASGALLGKGYGECDLITPRPSWEQIRRPAWGGL